ncbi:hypothetical protein ACVWYN_001007 [Pedobacter sp. UYP24]
MSIKKLFFMCFFTSLSGICFAQVKLNVKAGLNYANVIAKDDSGTQEKTYSIPGIYAGLGINLQLSDQFSIQPAIAYARRGFKERGATNRYGFGEDFKAMVSYFELPIDFIYAKQIGEGKLLFAAGPYVGYGTGGKWTSKSDVIIGDIAIGNKGDIKFQSDASYGDYGTYVYAKPWDYGVHFSVGYSFCSNYSISFNVQQGIANLQPRWSDYRSESSVRNKSIGLTAAYSF